MTRAELIAALEKAEGPSRTFDFWCWWWCKASIKDRDDFPDGDYVRCNLECKDAPRYTASIDAALTLVPEGAWWTIDAPYGGEKLAGSSVYVGGKCAGCSRHKIPAIALCIAALKVRGEAT